MSRPHDNMIDIDDMVLQYQAVCRIEINKLILFPSKLIQSSSLLFSQYGRLS